MVKRPASIRVVIFPGKYVYFPDCEKYWEIPGNMGNTGEYKISNNGLLVGFVVGMLTYWKLIKLGTKHIIGLSRTIQGNQNSFIHLSKSYFHKTIHF